MISLTQAQIELLPLFHRITIPESYIDVLGHMNVREYIGIFDDAAWYFFASFGMDEIYFRESHAGAFALRQMINYVAEVHMGETVVVRSRILGRSAKRIHFMQFMFNETTGKLASTIEVLGSHADTVARRTSPFPDHIAQQIDAIIETQSQLDWDAPICGILRP